MFCITNGCHNEVRNKRSSLCQECFNEHLSEKINDPESVLQVNIDVPANEYF